MTPNFFGEKSVKKFYCEICDFKCFRSYDYERHLLTRKHERLTNPNIKSAKSAKTFECCCGKKYRHMSSLSAHKRKNHSENAIHPLTDNEIINALLEQNDKLIKLLGSGISTTNNNTNNNNTTNINNIDNKSFNLNFFLNETCKDAMNMSDFVSSIRVNIADLEHTGREGYVQGITNIVLNNLKDIEQHMRPLHCSDSKREIFYIKDNNAWTKENDNKPILTNAIKKIANENIKQIKHWRDKYPDCTSADSKKNNTYLKIVSNSMNGLTEEEGHRNIDKIISNIAKEVTIDKKH